MNPYQQQHVHNDVPGTFLHPELERGRQQIRNLDFLVHYLFMEYSPNVYMVFVALPVLLGIAALAGMFAKDSLLSGWGQQNLFVGALGVTLLVVALGVVWVAIRSTANAFKHMNWFAKVVIIAFVGRMIYWLWVGSKPGTFPWIDVAAAFLASAISEVIYDAWRSRKGGDEDEWA